MKPTANQIICGSNIDVVKPWPANCIDSIVTDAPYELGFMDKGWDSSGIAYSVPMWRQMLRITKPGGFLLCFGGTRTFHRLACAIEDAGWEIRDCMMWLYGQGFPKSHNIKKALEKKYKCGSMEVDEKETKQTTKYYLRLVQKTNLSQTVHIRNKQGEVLQSGLQKQSTHETMQREESQERTLGQGQSGVEGRNYIEASQRELQGCKICALSEGLSEDGKKRWLCNGTPFGYGTSHWTLAPANRSCPSYRPQSKQQQSGQLKTISDKSSPQEIRGFIEKWTGFGTAMKPSWEPIIVAMKPLDGTFANNAERHGVAGLNINAARIGTEKRFNQKAGNPTDKDTAAFHAIPNPHNYKGQECQGRWPANLILDEEAGAMLDEQTGNLKSGAIKSGARAGSTFSIGGEIGKRKHKYSMESTSGGASRFFYCAKASRKERNMGLEDQSGKKVNDGRQTPIDNPYQRGETVRCNTHPTVKPLALMKYLCTLLKMPSAEQIILDPFLGSGTTGMACASLGIGFIGIEKELEYCEISSKRISAITGKPLPVTKNVEPLKITKDPVDDNQPPSPAEVQKQKIINAAVASLRNRKNP